MVILLLDEEREGQKRYIRLELPPNVALTGDTSLPLQVHCSTPNAKPLRDGIQIWGTHVVATTGSSVLAAVKNLTFTATGHPFVVYGMES